MVKDEYAGLFAAFLLNTSIYSSVIAGTFILPDTPQLLFWLLSIFFLLRSIVNVPDKKGRGNWLIAGTCIGLATLSKYHGVFIGLGAFLYVLIYNRAWLKEPTFYLGIFLALVCITPIIYWNFENHFITFTFQGERVTPTTGFHPEYLLRELVGQFLYNNPVNYVIVVMAMMAVFKGIPFIEKKYLRLLLLNGLPLWATFTSFAIFRETLPHWSAPAFTPLLIVSAAFLRHRDIHEKEKSPKIPGIIKTATYLIVVLAFLAILLINYLPGTFGKTGDKQHYGQNDFTLDMYGWHQISAQFDALNKKLVQENAMKSSDPIIATKYFRAPFVDYYVATPIHKKVLAIGTLHNIHKYAWIDGYRGGMKPGENAYFISTSNYYVDPEAKLSEYFQNIQPLDTITVRRSGKTVYYAFVYKLAGYKGNFDFDMLKK